MRHAVRCSGFVLFLILFLSPSGFTQETLTITTYYPSPYGSYNELRANELRVKQMTVGSAYQSESLADGELLVSGSIGIGTITPRSKLEIVGGGIQIDNDAAACDATKAGTIRYNSGVLEYCNSSSWSSLQILQGTLCGMAVDGVQQMSCLGFNPAVDCPSGYTSFCWAGAGITSCFCSRN
ncbi:MAG: hypothetical protein V1923_05510 [Candidatus Omnitrophota bacterium]